MKRIISFSLWGSDPKYLIGAKENLRLRDSIYPGWTCQFYVDNTVPERTLLELLNNGANLIFKPNSDGFEGLFWRFEPGFEHDVERFIVRDCDSRINIREADAVKEWEESGLAFHSMRDHHGHDIRVLGAMWGAKAHFLPDYRSLYMDFLAKMKHEATSIKRGKFFYTDQIFLNQVIWPKVLNQALVHDDQKRFTGTERPFRVKLPEGLFIGQQYGADNKPLAVPV